MVQVQLSRHPRPVTYLAFVHDTMTTDHSNTSPDLRAINAKADHD